MNRPLCRPKSNFEHSSLLHGVAAMRILIRTLLED